MLNFYFVGRAVFRQKRIDRFHDFAFKLNSKNIQFNLHFFSNSIPEYFYNMPNIYFHGYKKDWINYIDRDFIMLLFSDYEGCPLSVLEAYKNNYKKIAVLEMPGIESYISKNCIFKNVEQMSLAFCNNQDFVNHIDLSIYFDEKRFFKEVHNFSQFI